MIYLSILSFCLRFPSLSSYIFPSFFLSFFLSCFPPPPPPPPPPPRLIARARCRLETQVFSCLDKICQQSLLTTARGPHTQDVCRLQIGFHSFFRARTGAWHPPLFWNLGGSGFFSLHKYRAVVKVYRIAEILFSPSLASFISGPCLRHHA